MAEGTEIDAETALKSLKSLQEGVELTEEAMHQVYTVHALNIITLTIIDSLRRSVIKSVRSSVFPKSRNTVV